MQRIWKRLAALALAAPAAAPALADEDLVARGEYLVRVTAACGNCHTPSARPART